MKNRYITVVLFILTIYLSGCSDNGATKTSLNVEEDNQTTQLVTGDRDIQVKIENDSIEVYWKSDLNIKSYILEFGDKAYGFSQEIPLNGQTTRYIATDLEEGHTYIFRLTSVLVDGTTQVSQVIEVTTATSTQLLQTDTGPSF